MTIYAAITIVLHFTLNINKNFWKKKIVLNI